ncbi:MAG: ChbG/HpnK family deacetylase [Lachnospiraceae bacterium]|nr:ChbG/HpnK family deacetylase [Lachnospiraceae bacterium]
MKLIVRADDVGYTLAHNMGTYKTLDEGIVTSCDLMLDCPGFEDACEHLRNYPWISIGWHTHFWGKPVLPASEVPSMVNEEGRFKWRKDKKLVMEVDYEEALKECRAQVERCEKLLGRVPDTCGVQPDTPLGRAIQTVCDEYHIAYGFVQGKGYGDRELEVKPEYKALNIFEYTSRGKHTKSLNVVDFPFYDPASAIMDMPIIEDRIWMRSQHPGFLDDYVLTESSCTIPRVKDVEALCDPAVIAWIKENKIELVNHRDALYGTNEYQNHLKAIGSDLAV